MKHIVFDLGQVLIQWKPEQAFESFFQDTAAMRDWMDRVDFSQWNRLQDGGRPLTEGLAQARKDYGSNAAPLENYTELFPRTIATPISGSWKIAESLKANGHRTFAITNWSRDNWPAALANYPRLKTLFEDIVVSGVEGLLKPAPEIYLTLTRRNGIKPADCVFIDDSIANVDGARAVGMDAIHFTGVAALKAALTERGIG